MGFAARIFTVLFARNRLPGWITRCCEMNEDLATTTRRPHQRDVGPAGGDWLAVDRD